MNQLEPPRDLKDKILTTIEAREMFALRARMTTCVIFFWFSLYGVVSGGVALVEELGRSGFFSIVGLVVSDFSSTVANLPDFILSVTESVPALPAALVLGSSAIVLWSGRTLVRDASAMWRVHKFSFSHR